MTIDDRLRGTYQRHLHRVEDELASTRPGPEFHPTGPSLGPRLLLAGAFATILAVGAIAAVRLVGEPAVPLDAGDGGASSSVVEPTTPATTPVGEEAETEDAAPGPDQSPTTTTAAEPTEDTTRTDTTVATDTSSATPATADESSPASTTVGPTGGVANTVCPSGARAELEWAALRYVGDSRGWGRMDDLVDEQDGPFYFEAWEPSFTDPVTVEISLTEPVLATEIRVAQDPFTEVGGTIAIDIAGETIELELSGVGDWRVHEYAEPMLVESFTITRSAPESNIMEVLLCVEPAP